MGRFDALQLSELFSILFAGGRAVESEHCAVTCCARRRTFRAFEKAAGELACA